MALLPETAQEMRETFAPLLAAFTIGVACLMLQYQADGEAITHVASIAVLSSILKRAPVGEAGATDRSTPRATALAAPLAAPLAPPQQNAPKRAESASRIRGPARSRARGGDPPRVGLAVKQREQASLLRQQLQRGQADGGETKAHEGEAKSAAEAPAVRNGSTCSFRGVYHMRLRECRCTAGWGGKACERREARACNYFGGPAPDKYRGVTNMDSLCAGNCDEDRGHCYCAGLATPFQRPLPHFCAPWAHRTTRLPDGRPAYPVNRSRGGTKSEWRMARLVWEKASKGTEWKEGWARLYAKPFELIYGSVAGNPMPADPALQKKARLPAGKVPYCQATRAERRRVAISCTACYEGRTGPFCELPKRSYCLRDCSDNGWCDAGFCWCRPGWFGVDCSEHAFLPPKPALQAMQQLPSPAAASPLRVYVYDMPSMFTTRNLQWRNSPTIGLHRTFNGENHSHFTAGSLYAMESALHEWLLDSPLRTLDPSAAHLFFVPIYAASLFMWPISKFADVPYLGRRQNENRRRSHQGALLLKAALRYIQRTFPFWNRTGGRDHVWMMLHDEGPCFCPRELRASILLTHYGYWSKKPRPWGTYYDDNFMQDPSFYARHIGDPERPTPCFSRKRDIVIPPWKVPSFWVPSFNHIQGERAIGKERKGLVFFAGDLGMRRLKGYSHDLRQWAYSMFCDPQTTKMRNCTPFVYGCREDMPLNCSRWEPGVKISTHSSQYHDDLQGHKFCLAFPGDGWSSRVLDAVVHGCIPVVVQDESYMFFEGAFRTAKLGVDYHNFSVRIAEQDLPLLVKILRSIPEERVLIMRRTVLLVRDYFIYKDMYNPSSSKRRELLNTGRRGQDAFLLLVIALESRARSLGRLVEPMNSWRWRVRSMLDWPHADGVLPDLPDASREIK